jgi:hypothetical protein
MFWRRPLNNRVAWVRSQSDAERFTVYEAALEIAGQIGARVVSETFVLGPELPLDFGQTVTGGTREKQQH